MGSDVTLKDNEGKTALQLANESSKYDCANVIKSAVKSDRRKIDIKEGFTNNVRGVYLAAANSDIYWSELRLFIDKDTELRSRLGVTPGQYVFWYTKGNEPCEILHADETKVIVSTDIIRVQPKHHPETHYV